MFFSKFLFYFLLILIIICSFINLSASSKKKNKLIPLIPKRDTLYGNLETIYQYFIPKRTLSSFPAPLVKNSFYRRRLQEKKNTAAENINEKEDSIEDEINEQLKFIKREKLNQVNLTIPIETFPYLDNPATKITTNEYQNSLHFILINDVYLLEPSITDDGLHEVGGPSRFKTLMNQLRTAYNDSSLILFAGDLISPSIESAYLHGKQMIEIMNHLNIDYASLGNHEFDFDMDILDERLKESEFTWLNGNCYDTTQHHQLLANSKLRNLRKKRQLINHTKEYTIVWKNGIKIGLFGLMFEKVSKKGYECTDPIKRGKEIVAKLKAQNCDLIILLSHEDWLDDEMLLREIKGLDFVVGGHDHDAMFSKPKEAAPVFKSALDFKNFWYIKLDYDLRRKPTVNLPKSVFTMQKHLKRSYGPSRKRIMTRESYHQNSWYNMKVYNVPVSDNIPLDPETEKIIAKHQEGLKFLNETVMGHLYGPLNLKESVVRRDSTYAGHFFADAFLKSHHLFTEKLKNESMTPELSPEMRDTELPDFDIALMNGGGIRGDKILTIPKDQEYRVISKREMLTWNSFHNELTIYTINLPTIVRILETLNNKVCGGETGFLLHPAGFMYDMVCDNSNNVIIYNVQIFDSAQDKYLPMKDDRNYTLCTIEYLYDHVMEEVDTSAPNFLLEPLMMEAPAHESTLLVDSHDALFSYIQNDLNGIMRPDDTVRFTILKEVSDNDMNYSRFIREKTA